MKITPWNGKPVTKAGVYSEVPLDVYHSQEICDGPSVSSSGLRRILTDNGGSPAHFWCEWSANPNRIEAAESAALTFGRAAHHLLLGQTFFSVLFVVRPEEIPDKAGVLTSWDGRKTVCQDWLKLAARGGFRWDTKLLKWVEAPGQPPLTVIKGEEAKDIIGIGEAITKHGTSRRKDEKLICARELLVGEVECSMFWKDATGLWLKCRPDAIPTDSGDFADLKTTTSVGWNDLTRTIGDYAYHQQAALIFEGSRIAAKIEPSSFTLVFVEKKPPYCVSPVVLRPEDIALGNRQNRRALDIIATCIERGEWPGPGDEQIVSIGIPEWYEKMSKRNCDEFDNERKQRSAA